MKWIIDAERFNHLCEGFKNIALAIAVLVGGLWTAYSFWSLKTAENANLEYNQKKERWPTIKAEISTALVDAEVDDYYDKRQESRKKLFLQATVLLKNVGNFPTILDHSQPSLIVSRLNSASNEKPALTGARTFDVLGAERKTTKLLLAPGGETELQYMVDVLYSGIHIVEFRIPHDPRALESLVFGGSEKELRAARDIANAAPKQFSTSVYAHVPSDRVRPPVQAVAK